MLKDLVPGIERVGFLHAPPSAPKDFFQYVAAAAASHGLKLVPVALSSPAGPTLDATIAQFAAEADGGLVVMPSFITARSFALRSSEQLHDITCRLFTAIGSS